MEDLNNFNINQIKEKIRQIKIEAINIPEIQNDTKDKKIVIHHLDDIIDMINQMDETIDLKAHKNGKFVLEALAYVIHELDELQEWTVDQKLLSIHLHVIYDAWYYFLYGKSPY